MIYIRLVKLICIIILCIGAIITYIAGHFIIVKIVFDFIFKNISTKQYPILNNAILSIISLIVLSTPLAFGLSTYKYIFEKSRITKHKIALIFFAIEVIIGCLFFSEII